MNSLLGRFFFKALLVLLLLLPPWVGLAGLFAAPVAALAGALMKLWFPWWVHGAVRVDAAVSLDTWLTITQGGQTGYLTVEANFAIYGYGLPLLAALLLASNARRPVRKIVLGGVCLLPIQTFGVMLDWLKQIALTSGLAVADQVAFSPLQRELVALGYQFGFLVLPALAPAVLWLMLDRRFLPTLLVERALADSALGEVEENAPASENRH